MSVASLLSSLLTARGAYFLLLLFVSPWIDYLTIDRRHTSTASRLRLYRTAVACLLFFSLIGYALHDHHTILHASAALQKQAGWHELYGGWLYRSVAALTLASTVSSVYIWRRCHVDQVYRATNLPQLRSLRYLLPVTSHERRWYAALSLAAGLCEEFMYRLLLLHWLSAHMPPMTAVLAGGVAFGCAHVYQGLGGVVRASAAGVWFGLAYVLFGSVALVAVQHVAADLQVLVLYRPMEDTPKEAEKLVEGCKLEAE